MFADADKIYPVYARRKKGLDVKEIISICIMNPPAEHKVCAKGVPPFSRNSVYVVDLSVIDERDITCDDSGTYSKHSSPSAVVQVQVSDGKIIDGHVLSRKKVSVDDIVLKKEHVYHVKRNYSEKEDRGIGKVHRIISRVNVKGKTARYAVVQYVGGAGNSIQAHGNAKDRSQQFIRTKPSILNRERELAMHSAPKKVVSAIDEEAGGPCMLASPSDAPRNRQQVYNVK